MNVEALVQKMEEKTALVGTIVRYIDSFDQAVAYTADLCQERSMNGVTCIDLDKEDEKKLSDLCAEKKITFFAPPLRTEASSIDVALTWADAGIADTGSIMVRSNKEDLRIATMVSKIHIAVLPEKKVRENSAGIESELDAVLKSESPSYTAFITGPSRTADIERVLAIGVHGPLELHLLIMKESAE